MPLAQLSSSDSSVGAGSPRMVSVNFEVAPGGGVHAHEGALVFARRAL